MICSSMFHSRESHDPQKQIQQPYNRAYLGKENRYLSIRNARQELQENNVCSRTAKF